jgi:cyclase
MRPRVIPCLLLKGERLVKTVRFGNPVYVGDPINTVRIFNEKEVDELVILDIAATLEGRRPAIDTIARIASEAFMPVAYGGGIRSLEDARAVLACGVEKVVINTAAAEQPDSVREIAAAYGNSSVVISIDVRRKLLGRREVCVRGGRKATGLDPVASARAAAGLGAGEILLNSIDRDGTMQGYDIELVRSVARAVAVPVIACGGAGSLADFSTALREGGASAVAAGSFFVFHGRHRAVLISYPSPDQLSTL